MDKETKEKIAAIKAMANLIADEERMRQKIRGGPSIANHWNDNLLWLLTQFDSLEAECDRFEAGAVGFRVAMQAGLAESEQLKQRLADAGSETKHMLNERAAKAENALADCRQEAGFILAMLHQIEAKVERIKTKGA